MDVLPYISVNFLLKSVQRYLGDGTYQICPTVIYMWHVACLWHACVFKPKESLVPSEAWKDMENSCYTKCGEMV